MAEVLVSRTLKAKYGTDADTEVTHSMPCVENPDAENVSTVMDTVISKGVFEDGKGNPLSIALSATVRSIRDDVLFE